MGGGAPAGASAYSSAPQGWVRSELAVAHSARGARVAYNGALFGWLLDCCVLQYSQYYQRASQMDAMECQQWFAAVDRDRSGSITPQELQNLSFGGRPLGYQIALKLVKVFDRDRSGSIGTCGILLALSRRRR